jgi:hypothetical protein
LAISVTFSGDFSEMCEEMEVFLRMIKPELFFQPGPLPPPAPAPVPAPVSEPVPVRSHHKKKGNGAPPEPPAPVAVAPPAPAPSAPPDPAPPAPALADDIPTLDALKHAITVTVRNAQQGKGPKDILNLLPAFKKRTGLEFIATADETHRGALHELTIEAGIDFV